MLRELCLGGLLLAQISGLLSFETGSLPRMEKRGIYGWIDPEYEYGGSMADGDWGWKKRSLGGYGGSYPHRKYSSGFPGSSSSSSSYLSPPPLSLPTRQQHQQSSYFAPRAQPLSKQYAFHSMADADWGWRKRKRSFGPSEENQEELITQRLFEEANPKSLIAGEDEKMRASRLLSLLSSKQLNPDQKYLF